MPERGTIIDFYEDNTCTKYTFTVSGTDGNVALLDPPVSKQMSGLAVFRTIPGVYHPSTSPVGAAQQIKDRPYFEMAPDRVRTNKGLVLPTTTLAYVQKAGDPVIELTSRENFPDKGRVHINLAEGGLVEFEYFGVEANRLLSLKWKEPFTALKQPDGTINLLLPLNASLTLMAEYRDRILNPAFIQLISKRVSYIQRTVNSKREKLPSNLIDASNADQYYELVKNTSGILELRTISQPKALKTVLKDVSPACSTLEIVNRHVLIDRYDHLLKDKINIWDTMTIEIVGPNDFTGPVMNLPATTATVLMDCHVVDPAGAAGKPLKYSWRFTAVQGSGQEKILTPSGHSTRLINMTANGNYEFELTVTNAQGQQRVANMRVLVDDAS